MVAGYARPLPAAHAGRATMTAERILLQMMARVARSLRAAIGATIIGASVLAGTARADQGAAQSGSGTTAAGAAAQTLEEVVVTAEKRESTVQKTPISVTAIEGTALQAQGVTDMLTLAQQVPGISFKTSGPGQTEFEMRGLTSTGGESPTVGFYLDDTALTPAAMAQNGKTVIDPSLFDLSRVEVLRGPQGTLYGAGSMGGTIKLVTNQPNPRAFAANVEGIGSGTSGGGFNHTENVMLNVPLMQDVVALRLVGTDKRIDGWTDRAVLNPFPIEVNNSTARGNVAAAPAAAQIPRSNWADLRGGRAALLGPPANWPFSSTATVTEAGNTWFGLGAGTIAEDDYTRQYSEELRLTSTGSGPLQWLDGGYWAGYGATSHVYSFYPATNNGFNADFGTTNLADNHRKLDIDQYAAFGEVSYQLPKSLKATVGARYYTYHSNSVTSVSGVSANGTSAPLYGLASNSGVTPKLNLAYIPDENTTLYGTVSN